MLPRTIYTPFNPRDNFYHSSILFYKEQGWSTRCDLTVVSCELEQTLVYTGKYKLNSFKLVLTGVITRICCIFMTRTVVWSWSTFCDPWYSQNPFYFASNILHRPLKQHHKFILWASLSLDFLLKNDEIRAKIFIKISILTSITEFRSDSEIIGNFRKIDNFYGHFIKR